MDNDGSANANSSNSAGKAKRANPLTDLIDSEKNYVELLAGVIRKVASAWSRANFPPVELDAMFRAVEAVYRANRGFLSKLKDIGPNPSSPKALGDLLMRWVEDLDAPYLRYCNTYTVGFDSWEPVQSNPNLAPLLVTLSQSHPPPVSSPNDSGEPTWTMDGLFALPRLRLKYYKKLYSRLLKSTQEGRSDHRLLLGANERLDNLMALALSRMDISVGDPIQVENQDLPETSQDGPPPPPPKASSDAGTRAPENLESRPPSHEHAPERGSIPNSIDSGSRLPDSRIMSSVSGSSRSDRFSRENTDNERLSRDTANTSVSAGRSPSGMSNSAGLPQARGSGTGPSPLSAPSSPPHQQRRPMRSLYSLESSLDTTQVLDIFTMKPKPCKLQIANPVNPLPFVREIQFEADVVVSFTPKAVGEETVIRRAHVVMLTDLFLLCERPEGSSDDGHELSLCFPPLAARHLRVDDESMGPGPGSDNAFQVHVMRKETLIIHVSSPSEKIKMVQDFSDAVERAQNLAPPPRPNPNGGASGAPSGPSSPVTGPNLGPIPPIMLPDKDASFNGGGNGFGPRSGTAHSFHESTGAPTNLLSPRNSEGGLIVGQFAHMGLGGGSDTSLPLSNESSPGLQGGFLPPPRSASFQGGNAGPPSPGYGPPPVQQFGGPPPGFGPGPGGFPPGRQGPPPGQMLHKSPSGRSLASMATGNPPGGGPLPPLPGMPPQQYPPQNGFGPGGPGRPPFPPQRGPGFRPGPGPGPGQQFPPYHQQHQLPPRSRSQPPPPGPDEFDSPPASPVEEKKEMVITGPTVVSAEMKCKVFLKQQHAQWKSLGGARLKLFEQQGPIVVKQLVVAADNKNKDLIISTIILTDGLERVGRTGIAIELSDKGLRTGIIYMVQLRNEADTTRLFNSLLVGSDRSGAR